VSFRGEVFRDKHLPRKIKIGELTKYLHVEGPDTLYVSAIKVNGKWIEANQKMNLEQQVKGALV
jgi:hypothetical protein